MQLQLHLHSGNTGGAGHSGVLGVEIFLVEDVPVPKRDEEAVGPPGKGESVGGLFINLQLKLRSDGRAVSTATTIFSNRMYSLEPRAAVISI